MNIEGELTMTRTTKTPANFTFNFVANDGRVYPVAVDFLARLPAVTLVGPVNPIDFRNRAGLHLHTVLPRCRVIVTVDDTGLSEELASARAMADDAPGRDDLLATHIGRSRALRASGSALADQLFVALQARRF
jgi:hypothetical protein